jgi:hypothetical protein
MIGSGALEPVSPALLHDHVTDRKISRALELAVDHGLGADLWPDDRKPPPPQRVQQGVEL